MTGQARRPGFLRCGGPKTCSCPKGDSPAFSLRHGEHGVRTPHGEQHWGGGQGTGFLSRSDLVVHSPEPIHLALTQNHSQAEPRWLLVQSQVQKWAKDDQEGSSFPGGLLHPFPWLPPPSEPSLHLHLAPWILIVWVSTVCQVVTSSLAWSVTGVERLWLSAEAVCGQRSCSSCKDCGAFLWGPKLQAWPVDALAARFGGLKAQGRPGSTTGRWLPCPRVSVAPVSVDEGPGGGGNVGGKCCLLAFLFCLASWQQTYSLALCLTHDLPDQLCVMWRLYTHCLGGLKPKYHFLRPILINVKNA